MFEIEQLIEDCRGALKEKDTRHAVHEIVARVVSDPSRVIQALGEPTLAGIDTVYRADDLTILNISWAPGMTLHPHDHRMWAVIGIYGGREDNVFYRRTPEGLQQHGTKALHAKNAIPLGEDIIHTVHNPSEQLTIALHVYGGDFFATPRSEWDPETLEERPYDVENTRRVFEDANRRINTS